MTWRARVFQLLLPLLCLVPFAQGAQETQPAPAGPARVRTEIPYREGKVVLVSQYQERLEKNRYRARGRVEVMHLDMVLTCDEITYNEETREATALGNVRFSQNKQWLTCSRADVNFANQTGTFYEAEGFTDEQFLITGRTISKLGPDRYRVEEGTVTSCVEPRPKWSFSSGTTDIRVDRTARLRNTLFRVKNVPVLYLPYIVLPMEKKERSAGFLPFHTGNSTSKGRVFSLGYYQTLGQSADAIVYGDYFSERGLAVGGIFRAQPNPHSRLYVQAYGISDRQNQGGANLVVDGESLLPQDFRAVARVNVSTNFRFRQAFADTFRAATVSHERSVFFLTRNRDAYSTNISFQRDEVLFPGRSLVIRKSPSIEFNGLGAPFRKWPVMFSFRVAAEGLSRIDNLIETPKIVQRLDFNPRLELRLPSLAGFSLVPSAAFRETFYSARLSGTETPDVSTDSLERRYGSLELDLRTPTLEKRFGGSGAGVLRHVIEPVARYRWIQGIDDLHQVIRFDEEDAIAETSEVEYGIVNRVFRTRQTASGGLQEYEFLSVQLLQKYYFDPTFGGAFRPGEPNIFYPLNTLTGFSLTGIQRHLAPTSLIARLSPASAMSYEVRADYDSKFSRFRDASVSTFWQSDKMFLAGSYFKTQALEPGTFDSNHIQGQVGYGIPTRGFSASTTLSYNIKTTSLLNSHSRMNYAWDCCGLSFEFQQFDLGFRSESRLSISFTLKGIGSFGNVKRPEALF